MINYHFLRVKSLICKKAENPENDSQKGIIYPSKSFQFSRDPTRHVFHDFHDFCKFGIFHDF